MTGRRFLTGWSMAIKNDRRDFQELQFRTMNRTGLFFRGLFTTLMAWFAIGTAGACMVCIPFPEDTATDRLLEAEVVVLARENPDKPFSFITIETLKGELENPAVDLFLNSNLRRRLAANPERSIVLSYDAETGEWKNLGYTSSSYESLIREILQQSPAWGGLSTAEPRARFFLPYLANDDPAVRELAYLEVGQASYDLIREADGVVPDQLVYAFLADPLYLEWQSLYILLLGVDANPADADRVRRTMASLAKYDQSLNLSAWATAFIEIDGEAAIDWLESAYLARPARNPDNVLEIIKALSVQGARPLSGLRPRIAESYGVLIENHPSLAGWAARDLTAWQDWRLADSLAQLRESGSSMDGATAYAIDYYVGRARLN